MNYFTKKNPGLFGLLGGLIFAIQPASATNILIDFGRSDNQTEADNFNNVFGSVTTLDTPTVELVDSDGADTGITLNVDFSAGGSWAGEQADFAGPFPDAVTSQPETALQDSMFIRSPASTLMTLTGLETGTVYDVLIYGARGNNGGANTEWTFTDNSGEMTMAFDAFNNEMEVALFEGLVPDANNELNLRYTTTDDGSRPRGAMSFMQIIVGGAVEESPLAITSIDLDREGEEPTFTVTWTSVPDRQYALFFSTDLENWEEVSDNITSGGDTTSYPHELLPAHPDLVNAPKLFYQVALVENN